MDNDAGCDIVDRLLFKWRTLRQMAAHGKGGRCACEWVIGMSPDRYRYSCMHSIWSNAVVFLNGCLSHMRPFARDLER